MPLGLWADLEKKIILERTSGFNLSKLLHSTRSGPFNLLLAGKNFGLLCCHYDEAMSSCYSLLSTSLTSRFCPLLPNYCRRGSLAFQRVMLANVLSDVCWIVLSASRILRLYLLLQTLLKPHFEGSHGRALLTVRSTNSSL